jgi:hypothetical protein
MNTPATPLIDWHALLQVLFVSFAIGIGLVVLFSVGVYALSLYRRADNTIVTRGLGVTLMSIVTLAILATGVWGFFIIINK